MGGAPAAGGRFSPGNSCGRFRRVVNLVTVSTREQRRALIVSCHADETRRPVARRHKIPQTLGPVFLAGQLNPALWDIRLHNELAEGPLEDRALLGWPDLVVLTGLTTSLDRMRQVAAYARTCNPRVVVVGGGHVARALPGFCRTFLDHVCLGDVEELREVVAAEYGPDYAADETVPRYDLAPWISWLGYAESTRYCNFACSFCTLTGEGRGFRPHPLADFRRQLEALGRRRLVALNDNNFYGSSRRSFLERLDCLREACAAGRFDGWSALVTGDFFARPENLRLARDAGCVALFTGVESFDTAWTASQNKHHNGIRPQVEVIRECLEAGIVFLYGLVLDLTTRTLADIRRELDFIVSCPEITLPAYVSIPIPIPGTPFFFDCLDRGLILPDTKFRDLDATTISLRPLDPLPEAAAFVRDLQAMRGYRTRALAHSARFTARYRRHLRGDQMVVALANAALISAPLLASVPRNPFASRHRRTHVSSTEALDAFYEPAFPVDGRYASAFRPVMLTDAGGALAAEVADDLLAARPERRDPLVEVGAG